MTTREGADAGGERDGAAPARRLPLQLLVVAGAARLTDAARGVQEAPHRARRYNENRDDSVSWAKHSHTFVFKSKIPVQFRKLPTGHFAAKKQQWK